MNSSQVTRTLAAACALAAVSVATSDWYVSTGTVINDGRIYRFSDDGTVKGFSASVALPIGIAWIEPDVLLVCDLGNQQLRKVHADGTDLGVFASAVDANAVLVDSLGHVLVSEYFTGLIRRFSVSGTDLGVFASTGLSRQGQLAMDVAGNIYTSSFFPGEQTIYRYDPAGNFLGVFSDVNQSGIASPCGLAFQSDGSLLVSNTFHETIDRLDSNGNLLNVFASTGMAEPVWVTVLPDDSVLMPSWRGGWIQKYDASGNDLGAFITLPHGYQILHGPEVLAPNDLQVFRGRIDAGDAASLAEDDGEVLRMCRFIVLNSSEPAIQMEVRGTATYLNPSRVSVAVKSKMVTSGAFTQQLIMVDENGVQSSTVRRTDSLGLSEALIRLTTDTDAGDFVGPDGTVRLRINIRQVGPVATSIWCAEFDRVAWTVVE